MKITCISDTHGKHEQVHIPADTDLLIHAGDISNVGRMQGVQAFLDWYDKIDVPHKVFIGGNHDFLLENNRSLFRSMLEHYPNLIYLEDAGTEIHGIKMWGSPITPFFHNWAFNRQRGADIKRYWETIPNDIDILITHGPPHGYGDQTYDGQLVGCVDLLAAVESIQPQYHIFGHIHEAYGISKNETTTFINASVLNLQYRMVHAPVVIDYLS
ncbi:MAG: metallophosphatase domain-containing protein [Saprospiraceae bacterium]